MGQKIIKDDLKILFEERVNDLTSQQLLPGLTDYFNLVIKFYENYKIENVETDYPDEDFLLFEYGINDWQDGKGENFTIGIIRQFVLATELGGYSQLHFVLYFNSEDFTQTEHFNNLSVDFENIYDWKFTVVNSDGFRLAEDKRINSFDIFLTELE